jgi:DNA-binding IclR family transcriptional regulator
MMFYSFTRENMPRQRAADARPGHTARPVAAVDRALALLSSFSGTDGAQSLATLATRNGLHKSTALRLLDSLCAAHFVQRGVDGGYRLGAEIPRLAATHEASFSLADAVLPCLRETVAFIGESAAFHVRQGDRRLCLYRVESSQAVRDTVRQGDVLPLSQGAGGRVLRAFSGARGALYEAIRRDYGVALVGDRAPDLVGLSVPVFGRDDALAGALTVVAPVHRMSIERARKHLPWLRAQAAALSNALGASTAVTRTMRNPAIRAATARHGASASSE